MSGEVCEYELVGSLESDVGNSRVSIGAPMGRALFGQRVGSRVEVAIPRGPLAIEVIGVRPAGVARRRVAA